eukprot:1084688-Pleurochrysis_carterae.AAC.1
MDNRVSVRAGRETLITLQYNECSLGANAGAGAWHACGVAPGRWCFQAVLAMRATGSQNLGSRAQALR